MKRFLLLTLFGLMSSLAFSQTAKIKPYVKFKWDGIGGSNNPCYSSGACGKCVGLCVGVSFKTQQEAALEPDQNGIGQLEAYVVNGNKLHVVPEQSMDNGNGTITIKSDFTIGSHFSSLLGFIDVVVKAGTYTIDYTNEKFGEVDFDIVTQ